MAHLNWHGNIVESYKSKTSNLRYHVTETKWILKTLGPRLGKCKVVVRPSQGDKFAIMIDKLINSPNFEKE